MKSLFDIQQKIRDLENSINEISIAIKEIYEDINVLRDTGKETDIDYETINRLSSSMPFKKHPLKSIKSGYVCRLYLDMLLNIVRMDMGSAGTTKRFIFVQWILNQANIKMTLEDAFVDCHRMEKDLYKEFVTGVPKTLYETFIVDALIVANIDGMVNHEVLEYIVHLCGILNLKKERLYCLSLVAKTALCQGMNLDRETEISDVDCIMRETKHFSYYIAEYVPELESYRKIVAEIPAVSSSIVDFDWKVASGVKIKEGDIIASYKKEKKLNGLVATCNYVRKEIKAPVAGSIFRFRYNFVNYAVISSSYDDLESIKEWVKKGDK